MCDPCMLCKLCWLSSHQSLLHFKLLNRFEPAILPLSINNHIYDAHSVPWLHIVRYTIDCWPFSFKHWTDVTSILSSEAKYFSTDIAGFPQIEVYTNLFPKQGCIQTQHKYPAIRWYFLGSMIIHMVSFV